MGGTKYPIDVPPHCPFGIHNIPFGIFSTQPGCARGLEKRAGAAVGRWVLELHVLASHGVFDEVGIGKRLEDIFLAPDLNAFAALPYHARRLIRVKIIDNLSSGMSPIFRNEELNKNAFTPLDHVQMHLPMSITDYTDFFSSFVHADNALRLFGHGIPSAFYEYPMAYNGRTSSISVSGKEVVRPCGFYKREGDDHTKYQASAQLDFEVEMGVFISLPINGPTVLPARHAADHIFGYVLLNDWSARDIQKHEMAPFGPFHSKSFLTSISPWIVTLDALSGSLAAPPASCSSPISTILMCDKENHGLFDVNLLASLSRNGSEDVEVVRTKMADAHWSPFQMVAYQSSSGCGMHTGNLLGTGTLSSPDQRESKSKESSWSTFGCLAEIGLTGHKLPEIGGRSLTWLEDGDKLTIEGWFNTADGAKAGFGGVSGQVVPAHVS